MLVNGRWTDNWQPVQGTDGKGGFVRQASQFRNWVTPDGAAGSTGEAGFEAVAGRYHLYVALICPWASRTLIALKLKHLDNAISVSVVNPRLTEQGWAFGGYPGTAPDAVNGASHLHEIYTKADPHYTGRATVPVLWDKQRKTIVNNESADIIRIFNAGFGDLASGPDLYPEHLREGIDALNAEIYRKLNNGVYRAGFATTQAAYEEAFDDVFAMLGALEGKLGAGGPFLFGAELTEADIRLFVTLIRFDAAYHGLFKCNLRRLVDYEALCNPYAFRSRRARHGQYRAYQGRLLFDQKSQPKRHRPQGPGFGPPNVACRGRSGLTHPAAFSPIRALNSF